MTLVAVSEPSVNFELLFTAARACDSGNIPGRSHVRGATGADATREPGLSRDEDTLVTRLRASDEAALEGLVMNYYQPLVRFVRGYVRSIDAAEDIVQAMFCWLWEQRDAWAPRNIKAYLYTAVRRRALNELEQESVRERYRLREVSADQQPVPDSEELVTDILMTLPEPQRTAVRLRYQEGLSFRDIATVLKATPAGAERMVQRAVVSLRAHYRV